MKLHLPLSLRKCLLALMPAVLCLTCGTANAGVMHPDVTFQTYTDYGQNLGRYVVGTKVNALLQYIRTDVDKGILIHYTDGDAYFTISNEQGLIDVSGVDDIGAQNAISPTFAATVLHNGSISASYGERIVGIGSEHALNYASIDIRGSNVFRLAPYKTGTTEQYDYMLQRQSKVQTDVNWIPVTTVTDYQDYVGGYIYHIGAGGKGIWNTETNSEVSLTGAYSYIIGGINEIQSLPVHDTTGNLSVNQNTNYGQGQGADLTNPLPNAIRGGDSGSPVYIYNSESGQYEYIAAQQSGGGTYGQARGSVKWTHETLESFNARVDMSEDSVVYLDAVTDMTASHIDNMGNKAEVYTGHVIDEDGNILSDYNALKSGLNTWSDLSNLKDTQNWYAYDAKAYLQRSITELFFNQNLVFTSTQEENQVILRDTIDLGVGYAEFNKGAGDKSVFIIESEEGESNLLNSAGYVINEGTEVHISFTNPDDHMYEWRKTGKGDLYIEGTGNSNALLNMGGTGKTYLKRQDGYAAYNVLLNTGATVVIDNVAQIQRDLTIGSGGGTLDMNGNSMDWYHTQDADGRFTINALTEQAVLANYGSKASVLTYKESGDQTYAGSFLDSASGSLTIDYQGGGTWVLNSIHTDLSRHGDSGLIVTNGNVMLNGTQTIHGMGSVNGRQPTRLVKENDWHYADSKMNVAVKSGAIFELGSHARLTGDVTVVSGATYIMREGVKERYEYVEGGALLEDTYIYRDFYGHKGNVNLEGSMLVQYSEGTTARNVYEGKISGNGSLTIDLGTTGAVLELTGDNSTHTGLKTLVSGGLVATNAEALGNTESHKWLVGNQAWIASQTESGADLLAKISANSTGTLALSNNIETELDLHEHTGLFIGAEEGKTVQYGTADNALTAVNKVWNLGGGGGELIVNFRLTGDNSLVLGAADSATGVVTLTNTTNSFSGGVSFNSIGIILNAVDGALGTSKVDLIYGNAFSLPSAASVANIKDGSDGIVLVDKLPATNINLTTMPELAVGASGSSVTYCGNISLADGAAYRFSAVAGGVLNVETELDSAHSIVIDAQGLAGGVVKLSGNESFDGNITVQGHKDHNGTGEITLALGRDMATSGAITLMQGGILDLAGHSLEVQHLTGANGKVINSASGGELVFNVASGDMAVDTALQLDAARKIGSGSLTLSGNNALGVFYVDAGALVLGSDSAAGNEAVIYLADGAELCGNGHIHYGDVRVAAGEGTLSQASGGTTVLHGAIYAEEGAVLTLAGGNTGDNLGAVALHGAEHGIDGGTIRLDGVKLILESNEAISLNGTITVAGNSTIYSEGGESDMARNINNLRIENGAVLTVDEHHWSSIWNIDKLSGEGTLHWHSNTTHYTPSVLKLNGEGDFVGSIEFNRIFEKNTRKYGAFIELLSNHVAQNASISLTGTSADSVASLVIKTDNAHIKGLSGNEHSLVYAGDSLTETQESTPAVPTTTRKATLTIDTVGENYSYAGALGHVVESADLGFSIVKLGAGTQAFTGTAVVNDVTVWGGALQFAADSTTLRGDINLATGAALSGVNYVLGGGKSFVVEYGADASASFSGNITLGSGFFSLDAYVMTGGNPVLNIDGSITMAADCNSQIITVQNIGALGVGSYTLVSGDWSSVSVDSLQLQAGSIYDTSLDIVDGVLKLNVALKQGTVAWDGTESVHEWSTSMFGSTEQALGSGAIALFNDTATGKTVTVTENVEVSQAVFATMGAYTVQGVDGAVATLGSLTKAGAGELVLESGVIVSGATAIENGSLVIKKNGVLQAAVGGDGELVIDWGAGTGGTLSIADLATLHIASGSYGAAGSGTIDVDNIIVDAGARYIQGDNVSQTANFVSNGGVLELASGGINGILELTADTELYIRSGDVNLDSTLIHNGHVITQTCSGTGTGIMHIDGDSQMVLGQYVVAHGTLSFDGNRVHLGHGTITVADGATLLVATQSALEAEHIILNSGGKLLLRNGGGGNSYVNSNITVSDGAIISGSLNGNSTQVNGTISGTGTLHFNTADDKGHNLYTVNSGISDAAADTPLSLQFDSSYVVLTGANTYSGGTTINSGQVTVNNAMGLGTGTVQLNGGSLVFDTPGRMSAIIGTDGELHLNNGIYKAQSLNLTGTPVSGSGSLVVTSGGQAVLGSGISLASLSVEAGASLTLGGNVCLDSAILNSGSVLLNSGVVFELDVARGDNGVFTLISGTGDITYGFDAFSVNNFTFHGAQLSDEIGWSVTSTDNTLQVTLTGLVRNRVWTGTTSAVWDSATQNWATESGVPSTFLVYDKVSFGADAAQKNVSWQGVQYVTDMQVTSGEYSFAGDGLRVQNNLELAAGATAAFDCKLDIEGFLKTAGNVALNITESQSLNVLATGGSLTKNGAGQLTWSNTEGTPIILDSLTVNAGSFVAESALQAGAVSLANSTSVTLAHSTGTAVLGAVTGADNASFILNGAGSLQLTNATISTLLLKGNSNVTIDGTVNVGFLSLGKTTVVLESGANVTTGRYTSGNTANNQPTHLTINQGAVLNVTGSSKTDNTGSSMLLAHWKSAFSEIHLNGGELNVNNSFVLMGWDSGGMLRADSGVANLYGIQFSVYRSHADNFILGSAAEGTAVVNIGAHGIKNIGTGDSVALGCGTLKATADWEATGDGSITFVSDSVGTIVDTNGHQITISSGIDGSGKLLKQGAGTLIIAGSAAEFTGSVNVQQGTLQLGNAINPVNLVHVSTGGAVQFNEGVTLANGMTLSGSGGFVSSDLLLNGGTIGVEASWLNNQNAAFNISSEYSVSFAEGITSQLISIEGLMDLTAGDYYLVNGQFAAGITADNFTLGAFADFVNASFTLNDTGLWLSVANVEGGVQIWDGTADAHSWSNEVFGTQPNKQQNTVIFTDSAANRQVQIADTIQTGALIFANTLDYTVSSTNVNYGLTAESIELSDIGKVRISTELAVDSISISKGTLELVGKAQFEQMPSLTMTNGAMLQIGDTPVTLGAISMEAGTTIADLGGTGELNITQAMELAGSLSVGTINTSANASFVAGANLHTLNVSAGTTTVHGALSASNINLAAGTTLNFTEAYTLAAGSTISVAGATTLGGDITMAGGTLSFDTALTAGVDALLSFTGSLSLAENAYVNISVPGILKQSQGGTFMLATGDFSAFETANFNLSGLSDSLWSFSLSEDKTQLSLTLGAYGIWRGEAAAHVWDSSVFGPDSALPENCAVFFNSDASCTDVQVTASHTVKSLHVLGNKDYHFTAADGVVVSMESFEKSGTGSATFDVGMTIASSVNLNDSTVAFNGATNITGDVSGNAKSQVSFGGDAHITGTAFLDGGVLIFAGADSNVTIDTKLDAIRGVLNIGSSAEDSVFLTVSSLEAGDTNGGGNLTINLAQGSTLKITGSDKFGVSNYKITGFLLSEWNAVTTLNVDGIILAPNASALVGDSSANITISGTMAVKGIANGATDKNDGTIALNLNDGAKLIMGASGINTGKQFDATLGAATIGISATEVTIAENLSITSASGTVFDTALYSFAEDGNSISQGTEGGTLIISGALTGTGKLIKQGAGTLKLTAPAFDYDGTLDVKDGTVTIYNAGAEEGADKILNKVELSDGCILQTYDAAAPTVATTMGCVELQSGATATVQDVNHSGYIAINNLSGDADSTLKLVKNAQSTYVGIFVLGDATATSQNYSFAGTIELSQATVDDDRNRDVTLQLNHGNIAKDAAVNLASALSSGARLGLGINVESATIAGLTSGSSINTRAIVYSGDIGAKNDTFTPAPSPVNELIINVAADTAYTYYGQFKNVDITKSGAGTQIFAGTSSSYSGAITVNAGVLQFESNTLSMLNMASSVAVNQTGILNLYVADAAELSTAVSMNSGKLVLKNNQTLTLAGAVDVAGQAQWAASRNDSTEASVWAVKGINIGGTTTVKKNSSLALTGNARMQINDGGTLLLEDGAAVTRDSDNKAALYIKGSLTTAENATAQFESADDIHLNYIDTGVGLNDTAGSIDVAAGSTLELSVNNLQTYGKAAINVGENAMLDASGTTTISLSSDTSINMEKGGALKVKDKVTFSNRGAADTATLKGNGAYGMGSSAYELKDGHLSFHAGSQATIKNKLTNSSVQNDSSFVLRLDNSDNTLCGIFAESGDIIVLNQDTHTLQELKLATELTIGVYTGTMETPENEARITVQKCAEFGVSTSLNADLLMAAGSELKLHGTVSMGSDLTIEAGVLLTGALYDALSGLINDGVSKVVLFEGIDTLYLGTETQTESITLEDQLLASTYFSNLENTDYLLVYDASQPGNGILSIMVPEPASSTLSLLALAAMAARRRRRK